MTVEEVLQDIKEIFPKKLLLTKSDVATIADKSERSLYRDIEDCTGIPHKVDRGRIKYPIRAVAEWICDTDVQI